MTEDSNVANASTTVQSLILDLNFVPAWARKPPSSDPYRDTGADRRDRPRPERRDRDRDRGPRDRQDRPARREQRPRRPEQAERGRPPRREPRFEQPPREEHLPLQVFFMPEQHHLAVMVTDIRASRHAFPLPEVAHRFLNSPEWHAVKLESNKLPGGVPSVRFFQAKPTGQIFSSREACHTHVVAALLEQHFSIETVQQDPPAGNFVCVGRCTLTGELLGPPNHHGYTKRVDELHRTRFAHMSLDTYRRQIETVRDPEIIEQWKQQCSTKTVHVLKDAPEGTEPMDALQARAYVEEKLVPGQVAEVTRAILSGPASRALTDQRMLRLLRAAWGREYQMPMTLMRALRGAFRHMRLYVFNAGKKQAFVTAIEPKPLGNVEVIPPIRETLDWLANHPGCSRQDLINGIRPDAGDDPHKLGEVLQPLTWLIDKGHVIEFYDGKLAVPR